MRLLIVTQVVDRNHDLLGAFHQWIVRFAEVFDSVEVICLFEGEHDLPENVRVHSLGKETRRSRLQYLWRFYRYLFIYRKEYDVVFVHMNPEYAVLAGLIWRMMRKTVFLWFAHIRGGIMRRLALPFVHRVVSVSKESFVDHASRKFVGVGHGIDTDIYRCPAELPAQDRKVILSIGRLSPVKGYDRLLDAAHLLKTRYGRHDFLVRLIGAPANAEDDAYIAGLKKKIDGWGMGEQFDFYGSVPNKDILSHLCGAAAFVSMQCKGGAGKSFLESMAAGVPTVVCTPVFNSDLGEWREALYYDGTAEDFAAKLDKVLSLEISERQRMGERLRKIVDEKHHLKNLVLRVRQEYESVRHVRD